MGQAPLVYRYDGSFEGFLCCVFDSVYRKELPEDILSEEETQETLYPERWVETDPSHAERVFSSFSKKISPAAPRFIEECFLTCQKSRERLLLRFILKGYRLGAGIMGHLTDDTVNTLVKAVKYLNNEAHLLKEFLRFSEQNGTLAAVITPNNRVLPLLAPHFCGRYPEETFLIYDSTHRQALIYRPYEPAIIDLEDFSLLSPGEEEASFRAMWKVFYKTIAIEGRYNPKCRMGHMPKRYWANMTEFEELYPQKAAYREDGELPAMLKNNNPPLLK